MDQSYYAPPAAPPQQSNTLAIISLIASILGLTLFPTIGSIVGLILGYMARKQIRQSPGLMGGEGLAKAGIILGWIGVALAVIGICLAIAFLVLGLTIPGIGICASLGSLGDLSNY
jgi:uncharacterized Tic20 family protein